MPSRKWWLEHNRKKRRHHSGGVGGAGGGGNVANPPLEAPSLTAPVLAFASATDPDSDNTQDFNATFFQDITGKVVRLVGTLGSATVGAFDVDQSNTIDATEAGNLLAAFTTGALVNGLVAFKCRIEDGSGNALSDWSNTVTKTITQALPTLTSPVDTATGQTTASGTVTTDTLGGTVYAVITTSSTTPTGAQIKAGQTHTGAAGLSPKSQTVTATGVQTISGGFTGLSATTAYFAHYVHETVNGFSNCVSGDGFTTTGAPSRAYAGVTTATKSGSQFTYTNAPIGTAVADRLVVVALHTTEGLNAVSSATIGGISATVHANPASANGCNVTFISASVPTGTTATIVVTMTGAVAGFNSVAETYSLTNLSSTTATGSVGSATASSVSSRTGTLAVSAGGVVILAGCQYAVSSTTCVLTATDTVTTDHSNFQIGGFSRDSTGSVENATANASYSVTATWNGSEKSAMAAVAFR